MLERECGAAPEGEDSYHSDRYNEHIGFDLMAVMYFSDEIFAPEKYN